jgi:hypothetical protein
MKKKEEIWRETVQLASKYKKRKQEQRMSVPVRGFAICRQQYLVSHTNGC